MPDSPPPQRMLTRQALYDLVWARPITSVAADLDLDPAALRSLCIEHEVPRPRAGHWSRIRAGHQVPPPPLVPASQVALEVIRWRDHVPPEAPALDEAKPALDEAKPAVDDAKLAAIQAKVERLVARTQVALRAGPPDHRGLRATSAPGTFDVAVDEGNVERVLAFLRLLAVDLLRRGARFADGEAQRSRGVMAVVGDEHVPFAIKEIVHQESTQRAAGTQDFVFGEDGLLAPRYIYSPTGRLVLHIGASDSWAPHSCLREGKRLLDARLSEASGAFFAQARRQVERREERARSEREEAANRRRLEEERARREAEASQEQSLLATAGAWDRARLLRRFIAAATRAAAERGLQPAEQLELRRWTDRAIQIAQRMDPLASDALWTSRGLSR